MKFRTNPAEEPELNLVPLIDVLLMTLIFLVVTTSFSHEAQLKVQLPEASAENRIDDKALRVVIDATGHYFVDSKQLLNDTPDTLRQAMQQAAAGRKEPVVVIHADRKTPHEAVIRVMDVARTLGITHLTFATQQPGGGKP